MQRCGPTPLLPLDFISLFLQKITVMKTVKITIQETSNPSILKFEADAFLTKYESFEFNTVDEANISPIAQQLFYLPFVKTYIYPVILLL